MITRASIAVVALCSVVLSVGCREQTSSDMATDGPSSENSIGRAGSTERTTQGGSSQITEVPTPAETTIKPDATEEAEIVGVSITVGRAYFEVKPDGTCIGAHASGGERPFIHQERGTVDPDVVRRIFDQARKVCASGIPSDLVPRKGGIVFISVRVKGGRTKNYQRDFDKEFENEVLKELETLLLRHHIGGW